MNDQEISQDSRLELTATIVSAYVSRNSVPMSNLSELVSSVHASLSKLGTQQEEEPGPLVPAVPIRKSVTKDYIISLEDGRKFKSLKRHLSTHYGMTPDQYRQKWGLPADYPMVAPSYAATRSALARSIGLGRKDGAAEIEVQDTAPEAQPEPAAEPKRRGRKPKA